MKTVSIVKKKKSAVNLQCEQVYVAQWDLVGSAAAVAPVLFEEEGEGQKSHFISSQTNP